MSEDDIKVEAGQQFSWAEVILRDRVALSAGSLVAAVLFWKVADWFHIPSTLHRGGLLLQQSHGLLSFIIIAVAFFAAVIITVAFASFRHLEGALLSGCAGLGVVSVLFGPMRFVLFNATGRGVYFTSAIELLMLYGLIAIAWIGLKQLSESGLLPRDPTGELNNEPLDQKCLSAAMHAIVMVLAMMILCATDSKFQALAAVGIAGYVGSLISQQFIPVSPSGWSLLGPLVAGLLGYITQGLMADNIWIGDATGFLAPLARATPLDFASAGVIGTLLGYWSHQNRQLAAIDQAAQEI